MFQSYTRKRLAIAICIGGPSVPVFQGDRREGNTLCSRQWWSKCSSVPELEEERDLPLLFSLVVQVFQCSKVIGDKGIHYVHGNGGPSVPVFQS